MKLFFLICFCCVFQQHVLSQSSSIIRSTTGASGASEIVVSEDKTYVVQQSVGQPSVIGTHDNSNYIFRQGFIQPNVLAQIKEKDIPLSLELRVYPNPFETQISLAFKEAVKSKIDVTVYDVIGRQVDVSSYQPNVYVAVRLGKLPSGEYILKVVANNKQFITKIIKK